MKITLLLILILISVFSILFGDGALLNPWHLNDIETMIVQSLRIPRILLSILIGATLANIGWTFQILFRNSLATPYTLGVSSVAAVALALSELLFELGYTTNRVLIFCLLLIPLFFVLLKIKKGNYRSQILMFGVCIGIFSSSTIILIQSLLGNESVSKLIRWMMGSLNVVGMGDIYFLLPILGLAFILMALKRKQLTLLSIGDIFAHSRGVDTNFVFKYYILICSIAVCTVVWICGPIGFVGLIIPHFTKRMFGADISKYQVHNILLGAIFLVGCDFLSRNLFGEIQLPIGAITATVGAPLLLYQVLKTKA
ncbi:iron ABC transporter permease [Bacteriovorax sp. Seq25_V]|uniref:FecCD family ABC transporter permease n=1 Tax=Bacteriovorax sp. Seq25_V TaxID=1201288 RepID=UPI000389E9F3|nr:iron ABC transporter permease [Bacteriovorax sp. Seq25_V]EQC44696.1 iron chelate uptake ABC transporter, FeCT family, permease protein [Bacteriovorax sp. Seq25_V]